MRVTEVPIAGAIKAPVILIVDDEEISRHLLKLLLNKKFPDRWLLVEAINGAEAVEFFAQYSSDIQLIVMDIAMPIMSGLKAVIQIRVEEGKLGTDHQVPIIMLSASLDDYAEELEALRSLYQDALELPLDFEYFLSQVTKLTESQ